MEPSAEKRAAKSRLPAPISTRQPLGVGSFDAQANLGCRSEVACKPEIVCHGGHPRVSRQVGACFAHHGYVVAAETLRDRDRLPDFLHQNCPIIRISHAPKRS